MKNIFYLFLTGLIVFVPACDESLPEYTEPENVLIGKIIGPVENTTYSIVIHENHEYDPPAISFRGDSTIIFRLEVLNTYDEVIAESTFVSGYVKIWLATDNENEIIQNIVPSDLIQYSPVLEIPAGGKVYLDVKVKFRNTRGDYIWLGKSRIEYPIGTVTYLPIKLKAKSYIRLYKKLGPIVTPEINFTLSVSGTVFYPGTASYYEVKKTK